MRGFPNSFNTKQDYLNCLEAYPEQTKTELRRLLAGRFTWKKTKDLESEGDGASDDTHRVEEEKILDEKTGEEKNRWIQMEYAEDENARLYRLGFTVKELQKLVA